MDIEKIVKAAGKTIFKEGNFMIVPAAPILDKDVCLLREVDACTDCYDHESYLIFEGTELFLRLDFSTVGAAKAWIVWWTGPCRTLTPKSIPQAEIDVSRQIWRIVEEGICDIPSAEKFEDFGYFRLLKHWLGLGMNGPETRATEAFAAELMDDLAFKYADALKEEFGVNFEHIQEGLDELQDLDEVFPIDYEWVDC